MIQNKECKTSPDYKLHLHTKDDWGLGSSVIFITARSDQSNVKILYMISCFVVFGYTVCLIAHEWGPKPILEETEFH